MKKILDVFRNMKIREKLTYSHIFIALIPFLTIGFVGIRLSLQEAERNVNQHTVQLITQVGQTLNLYINSVEKTVNEMIAVVEKTAIDKVYDKERENWKNNITYVKDYMDILAKTHEEIAGILYASATDKYISTGMSRVSRDSFQNESWYQEACSDPDTLHIISRVTGRNIATNASYSTDDVFSVVKAVKDSATGKVGGVMLFDIRHTIISSSIQDAAIGTDGFIFVLDNQDRMVYTPTNKIIYRIKPEWLKKENEPLVMNISGNRYHIRFQVSEYTGWKVVSVSSYQEIMEEIGNMVIWYALILVLTLCVVLLVALKISGMITRPILALRNLMNKAERGDLTVRFESKYQDEVSELGRKFNFMLERIQKLVNRVYEEEENKRQAQLKIVQEQFKPHFLYNTLDTINWLAKSHGAMDVVQMINALTNIFRIGLNSGRDYIKLSEEIRYISNYLYIQKVRYGEKVTYEIDIEETCQKVAVPKFLLQPLVENAIYHGVKQKRGAGFLKVEVKRVEEGRMSLSVADNGRGMDKETLQQLEKLFNGNEKAEENSSFGLYYVRERLRIRYGEAYAVRIESRENEGTRITIYIPLE